MILVERSIIYMFCVIWYGKMSAHAQFTMRRGWMFHGRQFPLPSTTRDGIINICTVLRVYCAGTEAGKLEIEPHVHDA